MTDLWPCDRTLLTHLVLSPVYGQSQLWPCLSLDKPVKTYFDVSYDQAMAMYISFLLDVLSATNKRLLIRLMIFYSSAPFYFYGHRKLWPRSPIAESFCSKLVLFVLLSSPYYISLIKFSCTVGYARASRERFHLSLSRFPPLYLSLTHTLNTYQHHKTSWTIRR